MLLFTFMDHSLDYLQYFKCNLDLTPYEPGVKEGQHAEKDCHQASCTIL